MQGESQLHCTYQSGYSMMKGKGKARQGGGCRRVLVLKIYDNNKDDDRRPLCIGRLALGISKLNDL